MNNRKSIVYSVILILFLVLFFKWNLARWWIYSTGYNFLCIELFLAYFLKKGHKFHEFILFPKVFKFLWVLIAINCLTCYIFRQQGIMVSLLGWESFFLLLYYPVFKSWNYSVKTWEKILFYVFIIVLLIYIDSNLFPDLEHFALDKSISFLEIEYRIRVYSDAILMIGALFCWNKYLIFKDCSKLALFILAFLLIFMQGYRILIASTFVVSVILYFRIYGFSKKSIIISLLFSLSMGASLYLPIVQDKIEEITNRTERDKEDAEDAVRALDIAYVYNEHFNNPLEMIAGSGMTPLAINKYKNSDDVYIGKSLSKYSKYMSELAMYNHFYTVDLGLWGLSWVAGIPFTLLFIALLVLIIRTKVSPEYYYIGMFAIASMLAGFTNALIYKHHNLIFLSLLLVILDLAKKDYINSKI